MGGVLSCLSTASEDQTKTLTLKVKPSAKCCGGKVIKITLSDADQIAEVLRVANVSPEVKESSI
jgi:hypothetical protein